VNDTVPPAQRLHLALDPTTDQERAVINALTYSLTPIELGVLARLVEKVARDRWPS